MTDNDRLPPEDYAMVLAQAWLFAHLIAQLPLERMIGAQDTCDAMAPLISPTLWREKHAAMDQDRAICRALLDVKAAVEKMGDAAAHTQIQNAHEILARAFGPRTGTPEPGPTVN
jgi:hypothetical protein